MTRLIGTVESNIFFRFIRPQPSLPLGTVAVFVVAPFISCPVLMTDALISAGLGFTPLLLFFQNWVNSAAALATCGAVACDVPVL
ncbi:MAG: hypothetical protein IPJ30_12695 [Acidobacteria bacterium]|nr:hypothetical protein [Acidobacteriota bacterium]